MLLSITGILLDIQPAFLTWLPAVTISLGHGAVFCAIIILQAAERTSLQIYRNASGFVIGHLGSSQLWGAIVIILQQQSLPKNCSFSGPLCIHS